MEMLDSDMFDVIPLKLNMNKLYPIDLQTMVWFSNIDLTSSIQFANNKSVSMHIYRNPTTHVLEYSTH